MSETVNNDHPRRLVVAIDGPSGSGKSSTSRGVARRLGLAYLDTGAMYRAATWLVLETGVDAADQRAVAELIRTAVFTISQDPTGPTIAINGTDVTQAIREPRVSAAVSAVATNLEVRADLIARQRSLIADASAGIVAEGRDITTVVAPEADVRVLLVADPAARVARRHAELGGVVDNEAVTDQVIRRDRDDATVSQFEAAAPGVSVVDSTHLTLEQVINVICALVDDVVPRAIAGNRGP
ncbi:cytidylate kinase [Microlunatus panaciterrae]|uniref:Cytidylate kinase n=1 Tax=Microlunatus panaciterrae TaxID=400768 RepID=A0ABS2RES7_9ACTN|nr:cytidylate kinase [Microlunatus panaciterrae]